MLGFLLEEIRGDSGLGYLTDAAFPTNIVLLINGGGILFEFVEVLGLNLPRLPSEVLGILIFWTFVRLLLIWVVFVLPL